MVQKATRALGAIIVSMAATLSIPAVGHAAATAAMTAAPHSVISGQHRDGTADPQLVQYRGGYRGPYGGPRAFGPAPRYYGGPRYIGPGRPGWGYRPWYHRPYYGTIIGGIALGTILGVTAYGLAPRPPRPDLCWYWADEVQSRGYWDYC